MNVSKATPGGASCIPLLQEWTSVHLRLEREVCDLGPRLSLTSRIDRSALSCAVPSGCLWTLVDNAIEHAVRAAGRRVHVRIIVHRCGSTLRVAVDDDGPGARPDVLDRDAAEGGLRRMRARLRSLYGEDAGLGVDTWPGEGLTAELWLPVAPGGSRRTSRTSAGPELAHGLGERPRG